MLQAQKISTLVTPPCPGLPHTFSSATATQWPQRYHLPLGFVPHYLSLYHSPSPTPSLPLMPSLPLRILCSLLLPGPCLSNRCVLLTLAIVIIIAITPLAPYTARRSSIHLVPIIIILVEYTITIQRSNGLELGWIVLPAALWLTLCPEIIATVLSEMLAGVFNIPRAGYLQIGALDSIPESMVGIPPWIVHFVAGYVKHLLHVWAEGCSPLPKSRTPAPVVRPHQLELWTVATQDWIRKDYIIKDVQCPLFLDGTNIVYPYESMDVFRDEFLDTVPIQWLASIHTRCRHFDPSSCLPLSSAVALRCSHQELNLNLHLRPQHYDTVACSGRESKRNLQSGVGYRVCFRTWGVVLCKSRDVEIVQDACGVFNIGG